VVSLPVPLTRLAALESWRAFKPDIPAYASARNSVWEDHRNISRLGAALRHRLITEDEIIHETLGQHSFYVAEKWLQEVCWRRYWKGWMETRPQVWTQWRDRVRVLRQTLPDNILARAAAVEGGRSGVACMDRIAQELRQTGYLHNHARMWWASFWIHVERLPWELGADFFFRHLLDADPASNTLSWRWVAGLQTRGKTYLVRLSNIQKYAPHYLAGNEAGSARLADGAVTAWVAETAADDAMQPLPNYPTSLAPTIGRTGLWLHPDDLAPELGPLAALVPDTVAACRSDRIHQEPYRPSSQRADSQRIVLEDGLSRASAHFGCPSETIGNDDPVVGLGEWAMQLRLSQIVAFAPMVGPVHDLIPRLAEHLNLLGVQLTLIQRPSDAVAFSFASAGFFPFWQKMSRHLNQFPVS
jgi:deoxyribodipyrimidine photo-lyase